METSITMFRNVKSSRPHDGRTTAYTKLPQQLGQHFLKMHGGSETGTSEKQAIPPQEPMHVLIAGADIVSLTIA